MLSPGIELYEFSTPIGRIGALRSQSSSIGLRFLPQSLPGFAVRARTKTAPLEGVLGFVLMLSPGIELYEFSIPIG